MKGYVYILELDNGSWYYGSTKDVTLRLREHRKGNVVSTKGKNPKLLVQREFETIKEAQDFERYLKKARNKRYIAKIMNIEH